MSLHSTLVCKRIEHSESEQLLLPAAAAAATAALMYLGLVMMDCAQCVLSSHATHTNTQSRREKFATAYAAQRQSVAPSHFSTSKLLVWVLHACSSLPAPLPLDAFLCGSQQVVRVVLPSSFSSVFARKINHFD